MYGRDSPAALSIRETHVVGSRGQRELLIVHVNLASDPFRCYFSPVVARVVNVLYISLRDSIKHNALRLNGD